MDRRLWLCPLIGIVAAIVTLTVYGASWLSVLSIAFLVAYPSLVIWPYGQRAQPPLQEMHRATMLTDPGRCMDDRSEPTAVAWASWSTP